MDDERDINQIILDKLSLLEQQINFIEKICIIQTFVLVVLEVKLILL